jgi:SAM-dependent methyltransferase
MTPAVPPFMPAEQITKWTNGLGAFDRQNEHAMCAILSVFGFPASLLDVGSGTGAMVNHCRKLGVDAWGLDALPRGAAWPHLLQHDLRIPFDFERDFNMVISIETAEHIEPDYADVFCDTVARHVAPRGLLIFSAAMPGQEGDGHVACMPARYWRKKFDDRGLRWYAEPLYRLCVALSVCNTSQHHVEANLQVFVRPG